MHPKEYRKEKNGTGHMTKLQLANSEVIIGVDFSENERVNEILATKGLSAYLLYPGKNSFNLSAESSTTINSFLSSNPYIFILDGTWPCVRKMLKLSKNLQRLERLSFDNSITSKFVIKQQPGSICLSTIESVYTVLNLLKECGKEQCDTSQFLIPFEKMIQYQVACILNPDNNNHNSISKKGISTKNMYKINPKVRIIYEQD